MPEDNLTPFQVEAESRVVELLAELGRPVAEREVLVGILPYYSRDEQMVVKLTAADLQVWLLDNEASFSSARGGGGFEREDYADTDALLGALLQSLRERLS